MAKEINTLGWLRFAVGIMTFGILMAIASAGSFAISQSRMAVIEAENEHTKETLVRIEVKVDKLDEFLRNQVR